MSIQVAILKVLASHGDGRATLASVKRDLAILTASGSEWTARLKRLAARVQSIDIFGTGYVLRGDDGWQITAAGRDFLRTLEAVTQDNLPAETDPPIAAHAGRFERPPATLIVVGHRFKSNRRQGPAQADAIGFSSDARIRAEIASKRN